MIKDYKKKPVVIQAIQFTGTIESLNELSEFVGKDLRIDILPTETSAIIKTLEGDMHVSVGDYVIKGVNGEFYPCKPDIFKQTYDEVIDG